MRNSKCKEPGCDRAAAWIRTRADRTDLKEYLCAEYLRALWARHAASLTDYSPIRGHEGENAPLAESPPGDEPRMEVALEARDSYLKVRLSGPWDPRTMQDAILQVRNEAVSRGLQRILVDGRKIDQPASDFYRYLAGQDVARFLPPPYRTAVIGLPETVTGFGEVVANLHGATLRVFVADKPAKGWLLRQSGD